VLIVQGEKTADAARRMLPEWVVVTSAGGDHRVSTKYSDWSPVVNRATRKVVWPDNDKSGMGAASEVSLIVGAEIVTPDPAWRQAWDLADAESEGWDGARVLAWMESHLVRQAQPAANRDRIVCEIPGRDLETRSQAIHTAIEAINTPPELFRAQRDDLVIIRDGRWIFADRTYLRQWLTQRIKFLGRNKDGEPAAVEPSDNLLDNIRVHQWSPLPPLERLVKRPVITADKRIILDAGYDAQSHIYYVPPREMLDLAPDDDPTAALALIEDLICDFPFVKRSDRAHWYAMLLQPALRELIQGPTPIYRVEAPAAGTGKGLLLTTAFKVLFDSEADYGMLTPVKDEDEWRKTLMPELRAGKEAIVIDNIHALDSATISGVTTAWPFWTARLLGESKTVDVRIRNLWVVTVNNPQFSEEVHRRTVRIRIDAGTESPKDRTGFRHHPLLVYIAANRTALARAAITLASCGLRDSTPFTRRVLGSYESWAQVMGGVLEALGIEGFLERDEDDLALDQGRSSWAAFIRAWFDEVGARPMSAGDLLPIAQRMELDLRGNTDRGQTSSLGRMLMSRRDTVTSGFRLHAKRRIGHHLQEYELLSGAKYPEVPGEMAEEPTEEIEGQLWNDEKEPF
ncbi:MAG TPA: hypothetical protein VNF29_13470, partial [Candidatus Binataceae bacterium]|nr:hypothetical protein [Candidatus Binataceae bacterium]